MHGLAAIGWIGTPEPQCHQCTLERRTVGVAREHGQAGCRYEFHAEFTRFVQFDLCNYGRCYAPRVVRGLDGVLSRLRQGEFPSPRRAGSAAHGFVFEEAITPATEGAAPARTGKISPRAQRHGEKRSVRWPFDDLSDQDDARTGRQRRFRHRRRVDLRTDAWRSPGGCRVIFELRFLRLSCRFGTEPGRLRPTGNQPN